MVRYEQADKDEYIKIYRPSWRFGLIKLKHKSLGNAVSQIFIHFYNYLATVWCPFK